MGELPGPPNSLLPTLHRPYLDRLTWSATEAQSPWRSCCVQPVPLPDLNHLGIRTRFGKYVEVLRPDGAMTDGFKSTIRDVIRDLPRDNLAKDQHDISCLDYQRSVVRFRRGSESSPLMDKMSLLESTGPGMGGSEGMVSMSRWGRSCRGMLLEQLGLPATPVATPGAGTGGSSASLNASARGRHTKRRVSGSATGQPKQRARTATPGTRRPKKPFSTSSLLEGMLDATWGNTHDLATCKAEDAWDLQVRPKGLQ
ncbi:unnamed protein product [Chrysoparadoxa australica]